MDNQLLPSQKLLDRRTRRTRRQLREALFALILEKGYDSVTIEDITERADLGRTTFYLHYRDKEELLLEAMDAIAEELIARLPPPSEWRLSQPDNAHMVDGISITFAHAAENAQLYRIILRGEGASKASGRVHAIVRQQALEVITARQQSGEVHPLVPLEVYANYFAGSLLGMVTWWLEANMPYSPQEMAEMFRKLYFQGGLKILGLE